MIAPRSFFKSLRHALRGLADIFRTQQNFRLQTLAAIVVLAAAFAFQIALWQGIIIMLLSVCVLVLEILNTIVERLADAVQPRLSHMVREIKDMMAGTVLLASLASVAVGILIFGPYLSLLLQDLTSLLGSVLY